MTKRTRGGSGSRAKRGRTARQEELLEEAMMPADTEATEAVHEAVPAPDPIPLDRSSSVKFELVTDEETATAWTEAVQAPAPTTAKTIEIPVLRLPEVAAAEDSHARTDDSKKDDRKRSARIQEDAQPDLTVRDERLSQARELVRERKVHEAIKLYSDVVADNPQSVKARNNLGVLYDELGQHERALEQFEAARALDPDNVEVLSNIGAALLGLTRFPEAEKELRRALKIDLQNLSVRAHLGVLHFRRGLYAQAEEELRWVCEHDAEHGPAHFYRGESLNRLGRVDQAMDVLEKAARLQPKNARIYQLMGILYDKKHMPVEASQMYKKVRELAPKLVR